MRRSLTAAAAGVIALIASPALAAGGAPAASACVTVPVTIPASAFVPNGKTSHYSRGAVLFVVLVEPAKYSTSRYPSGFPWQAPVASHKGILRVLAVCRSSSVSSLPVAVYAFRALEPGKTAIVADLKPRWKAERSGPARFSATIIVGPRRTTATR